MAKIAGALPDLALFDELHEVRGNTRSRRDQELREDRHERACGLSRLCPLR
jgi:hypothetical protein